MTDITHLYGSIVRFVFSSRKEGIEETRGLSKFPIKLQSFGLETSLFVNFDFKKEIIN